MKKLTIALVLIVASQIFAIVETIYFGCNLLPHSRAEMLCDALAAITNAIGVYLLATSIIRSLKQKNKPHININIKNLLDEKELTNKMRDELVRSLLDKKIVSE